MINNRDCFFYKKSDFINRLQDISPDSVCYIADTQQIYTHGRYFECNVTQDVVEQLIQNHGYLTAADLPVLTGGASPTPGEYVTGVSVGGHNINVQKGKLSEINVGTASKLKTPRKIELSGDLSGSIMFDGSQDVTIETIVNNSTTADRLTTPRTISLSSQATGQVSFDGSGNVNIPVTVNELDSKNSNNQDLNSLVTLNGCGGSLFYGQGGNTSVNKPSGVDWFGLFSFKSASGNYTTQILGSKNRLYSRSNADTSLGSWNTIAYLTDNVASATKLQNTRTFTISDGTNSGTASNFDGTGNITLRLPSTIRANIVGNITGDITGDVTGNLHGNADTATKLQTGRNINGTLFDGTQNITTAQWGTARNIGIVNSDGTGTAVPTSVNGSVNVNLRLPTTIKANLQGNVTGDITGNLNGNASTASRLQTARMITLTGDATGSTSFDGSANVSIAIDVNTASKLATARTITLTGDASGSASFDGSANISIPVTIANDSHTHATSASSNATTNLTITAGGTTATIADLYATYADQLRTARTISLTGDATGSTSFDGTANISIPVTVANDSHTHTFANITNKPIRNAWDQGNNNNITTEQFLDLLTDAGAFSSGGWFHARGAWSYATTQNITDTGYGTIDLAGCAVSVFGSSREHCTIMVIPPLNASASPTVELGTIYLYITNGEGYTKGWRKIARFEDINWNNITNKPSSFTPSSHTHPLSQISNLNASWDSLLANAPSAYLTRWPSINEVTGKQNLVVRLNGGTTEGTSQFTYNGTVAKTLNITPSSIGASSSSHTHSWSSITGKPSSFSPSSHTISSHSDGDNYFFKRSTIVDCESTYTNIPTIPGSYRTVHSGWTGAVHVFNAIGSNSGLAIMIPGGLKHRPQIYQAVDNDASTWTYSGDIAYLSDLTWSNINEKPSSFTPSSHTHPISQITNRGTLTFTGAATGSYDGSGNLTINIPEGGGGVADSVSWNNVTGKPSCYTPCEHEHVFGDITFNNTGTNRQYLAGDGRFYTISYSEISGTPDLSDYATESWVTEQINNASIGGGGDGDTLYTTASGNTSNKIFLVGATTQTSSGVRTYSHDTVYVGTDGAVYSEGEKVATQTWASSQFSGTDTKNTTGTSNSTSKLYLAGGTSQSSVGVVTYSNSAVYTQSGQLYATQMNATNGFYETSDARLKDFKEDVKALDTVDQIPTKYFTWKEDESQESQIGTSAQEVEKLYPELVSKTEDDTLTVDYAKLSIIALAAIKELKAEIQSLKEEIKQLKSK